MPGTGAITGKTTLAIGLAGLSIAGEPVLAELEEVIVTARKREESLQELPMSVTALDAATMERLGVRDLADVTRYTPGVNLDSGFGLNDQRLVIRGLSPSRGRPNSAILVDGIDLTTESVSTAGGSMLFNSRLLDIERVEVVKGPQSALYGRAAFTGAIQYVTRGPGDELESEVGVDIGDYNRRYLTAAIGGPITEQFGLRLSGMAWNDDGFYNEGFTGSSLGGGEGKGISLVGKWNATDTFSARSRIAYSDDDFDQQATFYDRANAFIPPPASAIGIGTSPSNGINEDMRVGLFAGTPQGADGRTPYLTADPVSGEAYPGGEQQVLNTSLILNWDIAYGTVTSYTGYARADSGQIFDADFDVIADPTGTLDIARGGIEVNFSTETRMFSQELRYASDLDGPVQFTVGAVYWDENVDQVELGVTALGLPPWGPTKADEGFFNRVAVEALRLPNDVTRDTESRSVYGLIEWNVTDSWKLSFEGRYAREAMDVSGSGCDPNNPNPGLQQFRCSFSTPDLASQFPAGVFEQNPRVYAADSTTDYYFAPRALVEWAVDDNVMTYFSISKGVKPGGIATVASGTWMDQQPDGNLDELKFGPEELVAYELGAKSTLFERTLILNGALFYQDYTDKQIPVQRISSGFPFTSIENVGDARIAGLELDAVWQATDNIRLQAGYSYLDGKYDELVYSTNSKNSIFRAGNCVPTADSTNCEISLSGNTMEDIPEHSLVALAGYYPPLGNSGLSGLLETDIEYQGARFSDEFNDREVASFTTVNMRIGVETDTWDALLYVNNVFEDDTIRSWSSGVGLVTTAERTDSNIQAFPAEGFSIAPPPRYWGVRANIRF